MGWKWVPLVLVALTGCGSASRVVRAETGRGTSLVVAPHSDVEPVELDAGDFQEAVSELARKVRPSERPLEDARRLFGVSPRSGTYRYEARGRRIVPLEKGEHLEGALSPADAELTRAYLRWCERKGQPGDCLRLLEGGAVLNGDGRYALAMALAMDSVWGETAEALEGMAHPEAVAAAIVSTATMYFMLWLLPEPISKGIALSLTLALAGYLGFDTVRGLVGGWVRLVEEVDRATTFDELRVAGRRYGEVMGKNAARIFVMLATAAVGHTAAGLAQKLPTLPGAGQAAQLIEVETRLRYVALAEAESVAISAEGVVIALAPNALAMMGQGMGGGGLKPKGSLTGRPSHPGPNDTRPENIKAIERENESARTLADNGYHVEQNPPPKPNGKKPDNRIKGEYYDCYAPNSPSARNIATNLQVQKVDGAQADRIILNLDDTGVTIEAMKQQLVAWPIPGLKELIAIKAGRVVVLFP